MENRIIIASDIGGVIKDLTSENFIENSIESLTELSNSFNIIFISKCKESYQLKLKQWLLENNLNHFKCKFCLDYKDKNQIAINENVSIMIDDKIQVLSKMNDNIIKIWFCDDNKRINGAKKFQPEIFNIIHLARNWNDVLNLIRRFKD